MFYVKNCIFCPNDNELLQQMFCIAHYLHIKSAGVNKSSVGLLDNVIQYHMPRAKDVQGIFIFIFFPQFSRFTLLFLYCIFNIVVINFNITMSLFMFLECIFELL